MAIKLRNTSETQTENLNYKKMQERFQPKIVVMGIGGAGGNAIQNMMGCDLQGVDFVIANTDLKALSSLPDIPNKIQLGAELTKGYGSGSDPEVGRSAAIESIEEIKAFLKDANLLFITAGMGGGTGTGASAVVAEVAQQLGILTIAVVTTPFPLSGTQTKKIAIAGIENLKKHVDSIIIVSNEKLLEMIDDDIEMKEAFAIADNILYGGVRAIVDLIVSSGIVNLDFNDIKNIMENAGVSLIGTGEAEGVNREIIATNQAIDNKLLENISIRGAKKVLINITSSSKIKFKEIRNIIEIVQKEIDKDAFIKYGAIQDETLDDTIRVSIIATGIEELPEEEFDSVLSENDHIETTITVATESNEYQESYSTNYEPTSNDFEISDKIEESDIEIEPKNKLDIFSLVTEKNKATAEKAKINQKQKEEEITVIEEETETKSEQTNMLDLINTIKSVSRPKN